MKLFHIDEHTGRVVFEKDEYKSIKEFTTLIKKDKGGILTGDPDGRLKYFSNAQFALIWWCNDPASPGIQKGYNEKELLEKGLINYSLPVDWKPTDHYLAAEARYKEERSSIGRDTYIEILRAFRILYKYLRFARIKIEKKLDALTAEVDPNALDSTDVLSDDEWKKLEPYITGLIKLADEIPVKIKAIQNAKDLLDKEESSGKLLRGSKEEIPDSMNPGGDPE